MRRPRITRSRFGDKPLPAAELAAPGSAQTTVVIDSTAVVECPRCRELSPVEAGICGNCGFPFICDIAEIEPSPLAVARGELWRIILGITAMLFLLGSGVVFDMGFDEFNGRTLLLASSVAPDRDSGIAIDGPDIFVWRTELTLGLLKLRAPDFYWRIKDSVTSIAYLGPNYLEGPEGKKISLERIGALAHTGTGRVSILYSTAFPSGPGEIYDRDLFTYAGVLVHELRHHELHKSGLGPGGMEEEVLCEEAAYAALKQMDAPGGILARYEAYLRNPAAGQYQHWYRWYDQWE